MVTGIDLRLVGDIGNCTKIKTLFSEGQATVIFADGSKEMRNYQSNKPNGQAILFAANGDRIEFNYENGIINGKASIKGSNGDKEACVYVKGVKHGPATYFWKAGHR